MRFLVAWHPEAQSALATIGMRSADRKAVTDAADQVGEELFGDRPFVSFPPAVVFSVSIEDRMVAIQDVWSWDNKS